jgi:ribosomal protein L37AE/L43A
MPRVSSAQAPEKLRPYLFHGIELKWEGEEDARADCPFCGKPKHFFVGQQTGLWQCKVCGGPSAKGGGNVYNFLRELHDYSVRYTPIENLEEIAKERRLPVEALERWGLCQSHIDGEWLLPGYGTKGITNLYRWSLIKGKRALVSTAGMDLTMLGYQFWDINKPDVFICEGPWDAIALEVAMMKLRVSGELNVPVYSGDKKAVRYATANVLAVPGCNQFKEDWAKRFQGKNVYLAYDSDYPKRYAEGHKQAGEVIIEKGRPKVPGYLGMETASKLLFPLAKSVYILDWGGDGYDSSLPDGFDVRDYLTTTDAITISTPS